MITVDNITKTFKSPAGPVTALESVSFEVKDGTFASIIGKSGSGKSTLLAILGALDSPTTGSIKVDKDVITKTSASTLTDYRRSRIGFVFQNYHLIPNLSALENVMLPMEFNKLPGAERRERAASLLESVGLDADKQRRMPGRLSGGEQQRVAIARALANEPKVILADEPTGNLDETTGEMVFKLLRDLSHDKGITVIAVTHDLEIAGKTDVSFRLADGKLTRVSK